MGARLLTPEVVVGFCVSWTRFKLAPQVNLVVLAFLLGGLLLQACRVIFFGRIPAPEFGVTTYLCCYYLSFDSVSHVLKAE